jgi:hypothetical protein
VAAGVAISVASSPSLLSGLSLGPQVPSLVVPTLEQLRAGVTKAGIAQLPLTALNSIIAVSALASELYPGRDASRWSPASVSISVGLMNLVGGWFGAMPCCHGSGGLAAQHKFGARWAPLAAPRCPVLPCAALCCPVLPCARRFLAPRAVPPLRLASTPRGLAHSPCPCPCRR